MGAAAVGTGIETGALDAAAPMTEAGTPVGAFDSAIPTTDAGKPVGGETESEGAAFLIAAGATAILPIPPVTADATGAGILSVGRATGGAGADADADDDDDEADSAPDEAELVSVAVCAKSEMGASLAITPFTLSVGAVTGAETGSDEMIPVGRGAGTLLRSVVGAGAVGALDLMASAADTTLSVGTAGGAMGAAGAEGAGAVGSSGAAGLSS